MYVRRPFTEILLKYPVFWGIILVNFLFYFLTVLPFYPDGYLFTKFAGVNLLIKEGEWWRLFTPILIHTNFNHLMFNSLTLFLLGMILAVRVKNLTFFLIYFSSGIFANGLTYLLAPLTYIHAGSSGAIFGIIGVLCALIFFKKFRQDEMKSLTIFIILAIVLTFLDQEINIYAHIGGLVWGIILGAYIVRKWLI